MKTYFKLFSFKAVFLLIFYFLLLILPIIFNSSLLKNVVFALCLTMLLFVVLLVYFKISEQVRNSIEKVINLSQNNYFQLESLLNILSIFQIKCPLPFSRGWAASPDFLKEIVLNIFRIKPRFVLEASSGLSTLVIGYALKHLRQGTLISLEHDEKYYRKTVDLIKLHDLEDVCQVIHAPLVDYNLNGKIFKWYDLSKINNLLKQNFIDLLIIDGPPGYLGPLARFPAIPLLYNNLSKNALIFLDDGARDDEQIIVNEWKNMFNFSHVEYLSYLEKGAFVLKK